MHPRIYIRGSFRPLVSLSVRPSVSLQFFFRSRKLTNLTNLSPENLTRILQNLTNEKYLSAILSYAVPYFIRIFVRMNLFGIWMQSELIATFSICRFNSTHLESYQTKFLFYYDSYFGASFSYHSFHLKFTIVTRCTTFLISKGPYQWLLFPLHPHFHREHNEANHVISQS